MHANVVSIAIKPTNMIPVGGPAATDWTAVGDELTTLLADQALESGHLSKRQRIELGGLADAV
eukprot:1069694-Prymnesium_polylepis.1